MRKSKVTADSDGQAMAGRPTEPQPQKATAPAGVQAADAVIDAEIAAAPAAVGGGGALGAAPAASQSSGAGPSAAAGDALSAVRSLPVYDSSKPIYETSQPSPRTRFAADIATMENGIALFLCHQWDAAEDLAHKGMNVEPPAEKRGPDGEPARDMRGVFALLHAPIALVRGVGGLTDGQLAVALPRLQLADSLLGSTEAWVGQRMARGFVMLTLGICMVANQKYLQGGWKIFNAWRALRGLSESEMLEYSGNEAVAVRSGGLFVLGTLYLNMTLLPPVIARWVGPGDERRGLDFLRANVAEGGATAPFSANQLLAYFVQA